jgi:hypothetical protein
MPTEPQTPHPDGTGIRGCQHAFTRHPVACRARLPMTHVSCCTAVSPWCGTPGAHGEIPPGDHMLRYLMRERGTMMHEPGKAFVTTLC